jgi:hypothetical protein
MLDQEFDPLTFDKEMNQIFDERYYDTQETEEINPEDIAGEEGRGLFVCLLVCLFVCFVCLFVCLFVFLFVFVFDCLFVVFCLNRIF